MREEPESAALRELLAGWEGFVSSALLRTEGVRAAARYGPAAGAHARQALRRVALLPLTDDLLDAAAELGPPGLRSLDALHLATALSLGEDLGVLLAYDDRLHAAARASGAPVARPGRPD